MADETNVSELRSQDGILRESVRQNLSAWLVKLECGGDVEKKLQYKMKMVKKLSQSPIAILTEKANEQHYEVPTEFFQTVLGKWLKYSSAYWPEGVETLEQAEDAMLELVCKRAKLEDGHSVMDLGCGWGVTGLWICEHYPNCTVVCVSNSMTQRQFIEAEANRKGYSDRLQCITADANVFTTSLRFDRIISVEMFEHMKNYDTLTARVASWLKPHGLLFIQILCHREFAYEFKTKSGSDTEWMARNFFSGGTMLSDDFLFYFQRDILVVDHWRINGIHYSKTLEAWLDKMDASQSRVQDIFKRSYGINDVSRQIFNWRMFFIYCAEVFGFKGGNDWIVSHYLFRKRPVSSL